MYFISDIRYNPRTHQDDYYYRIKESFRDQAGRPRHRLMLTVGFIDEELGPYDIRDIGCCLTWLHEHQSQPDLFGDALSGYKDVVRRLARKYWKMMVDRGSVDAVRPSNPSYIAVLCTHRLHCDLFFMITGKLQWTDGLKEG